MVYFSEHYISFVLKKITKRISIAHAHEIYWKYQIETPMIINTFEYFLP